MSGPQAKAERQGERSVGPEQNLHNKSRSTFVDDEIHQLQSNEARSIYLNAPLNGHVSRSSGLAKTILQGTAKGGRRQGRQRKRWEDNIGEWTGLEFAKSQRATENIKKWRKLVAKSSVVPQRPSRLRN